ncbi:tetratricopeptide repeat protein [Calditrichota bacterium]
MKRLYLSVITFLMIVWSCNNGQSQQVKPQKVYRIVYEIQSNEWYQKQAELWKQEIDKNPDNPEAWYNYYNANRYANFENIDSKEKKDKLDKIVEDMEKAIPGTYEAYLLKYWNCWNIGEMDLIEKAYAIDPDRPDTYYPFISHAVINGDKQKLLEFCNKLYRSKDTAPWLINYNYNVLMSVEKNAILITNGDNDTYPIWMLQTAKGVRSDVTVLNVSMSPEESYFNNTLKEKNINIDYHQIKTKAKDKAKQNDPFRSKFIQELIREIDKKYPDIPIYFALTVYEKHFKPFKEDLYVTGLANKYSRSRIDNIAIVKNNIENRLRLDYLDFEWYSEDFPGESIMNVLHTNYVLPFVMLAKHYKTSGQNEESLKWKNMALSIAEKANNNELIDYINEKNL